MKKSLLHKIFFLATILLGGFIFYWYLILNKYIVLYFQEQVQLFQFTFSYLMQCLNQPGGVSVYIGTFLTQFFYYPAVGACIYTVILLAILFAYALVLKQFEIKQNLFMFIPVLLLLLFSTNIYFQLAIILSLLFAFLGFEWLVFSGKTRYYYLTISLSICLLYLIAGGGILLTVLLFILYSFFQKEKNSIQQAFTALLSGLAIPFIFWYFIFTDTSTNAYFSFTPFYFPDAKYRSYYLVSWFLFLCFPLFRNIRIKDLYKLIAGSILVILTVGFVIAKYNFQGNNVIGMIQKADTCQWQDILDKEQSVNLSANKCFYVNLALYKTGQLPDKMFYYDQIGLDGLFVSSEDNFSSYMRSDFFLQLGLINEAKRQAYDAMVAFTYYGKLNVLTIKRLLLCTMLENNEKTIDKYQNILSKTLFYKNLNKKFNSLQNEIRLVEPADFFVGSLEQTLTAILVKDPSHQMAFEYLMAYYLLENKYEQAKKTFDTYFYNFNYPSIPDHYAEFLVLYKRLNGIGDDFYDTYPIKREIRENFEVMELLITSMKDNDKKIIKILDEQFKNTYWFYVKFPLVIQKTVS